MAFLYNYILIGGRKGKNEKYQNLLRFLQKINLRRAQMKKILSIVIVFLFLFGLAPSFGVNAAESSERVIIIFKNKSDRGIISRAKGLVRHEYRNANAMSISIPTSAIKGLKDDPNILAVEKDTIIKVKSQSVDWGVNRIEAPTAWSSSFTGKGVKIGIVDTGIAAHQDLIISGGASFTSYTSSYTDDNGHGTHIAGIIGARNNGIGTVGVANEADLYAVKVLGKDGTGYLSDIIAGIDWCISNKMDIINLSLGMSTPSLALQQEVDKAYNQGILIVAAAGNDGTYNGSVDTVNYPAKYNSVIAVSATDSRDARASFSSTGNTIEVAAPGVNIKSTYLNNQYASMSGTSMAAPFVAGDLALLKQAYPTFTPSQLRAKLRENVVDLGATGKDNWFGYGLVKTPKQGQTTIVTQPITNQPKQHETKTTVVTNKATYLGGEIVYVKVKVTDSNGKGIQGALAKATVTPPQGTALVAKGTTNSSGEFYFAIATYRTSIKGTYKISVETTQLNYQNSLGSTTFQIK